jgi:hypothetical protein
MSGVGPFEPVQCTVKSCTKISGTADISACNTCTYIQNVYFGKKVKKTKNFLKENESGCKPHPPSEINTVYGRVSMSVDASCGGGGFWDGRELCMCESLQKPATPYVVNTITTSHEHLSNTNV